MGFEPDLSGGSQGGGRLGGSWPIDSPAAASLSPPAAPTSKRCFAPTMAVPPPHSLFGNARDATSVPPPSPPARGQQLALGGGLVGVDLTELPPLRFASSAPSLSATASPSASPASPSASPASTSASPASPTPHAAPGVLDGGEDVQMQKRLASTRDAKRPHAVSFGLGAAAGARKPFKAPRPLLPA